MNLRHSSRLCISLLMLVILTTACAGLCTRRGAVPPTVSPSWRASAVAGSADATPLPTSPITAIPPTELPPDTGSSLPGGKLGDLPAERLISAQRPYKFGIVLGQDDPFFATILRGAQQSAINLGIELFVQVPQSWNGEGQVQQLEVLLARGDLDAILVSPADVQALVPALQKQAQAGIPILTLQTNLAENPLLKPLVSFTTDNYTGGYLLCQALVERFRAEDEASDPSPLGDHLVYLQKGISDYQDMDARAQGCSDYLALQAGFLLVGMDANGGDEQASDQLIAAILAQEPGLSAIVCTDSLCVRSASQALASMGLTGQVKLAAFDATPEAVAMLTAGAIEILATPTPADMGYLAVALAGARLDGVTSLPASIQISWKLLASQDAQNPNISRWYYEANTSTVLGSDPQPNTRGSKVVFVAGIADPFYEVMARGAGQAAGNLGAELVPFYPQDWSAEEQASILKNLGSLEGLNSLLLVPTDLIALVSDVQELQASGIPVIILDTSIDPRFVPLASIASDMQAGGYFACLSLGRAIDGRGKVYIQNVTPGLATTDARERGCILAFQEFPEITLVAVNYNEDDPARIQAQLSTVMQNHPDLAAVFCTNVLCAGAVGQHLASQGLSGKVKVAAFDATASTRNYLRNGLIDMVVAQKPSDMGYLGVLFGIAVSDGVTSLPAQFTTGFVLLTRENMDDPYFTQYFYEVDLP